jgi:hypothetical protein
VAALAKITPADMLPLGGAVCLDLLAPGEMRAARRRLQQVGRRDLVRCSAGAAKAARTEARVPISAVPLGGATMSSTFRRA